MGKNVLKQQTLNAMNATLSQNGLGEHRLHEVPPLNTTETSTVIEGCKESECGPLHSPYSCPSAVNHTKAKQTKTRNKNPPTKQTKRKQTPPKRGQLDSHELLMNSDSSLCAIIRAGHLTSNNNTTTRTRWPSRG